MSASQIKTNADQKMQKSIETFKANLAKFRGLRALF